MRIEASAALWYGFCETGTDNLDKVIAEHIAAKIGADLFEEVYYNSVPEYLDALINSEGLKVSYTTHGSSYYQMLGLVVGDAYKDAWQSRPKRFDEFPSYTDEEVEDLYKLADLIGWPEDKRELGWWIASDLST